MTPALLVLDLDGTALSVGRQLAPVDVAAARALLRAGVRITIATGRLYTGAAWVGRELGVRGTIAVMNGSEIVDIDTDEARCGSYLTPDLLGLLRPVLIRRPVSTFVFASRTIHLGTADADQRDYLGIWTESLAEHPDIYEAPLWETSPDVVALGIRAEDHAEVDDLTAALRGAAPGDIVTEVFYTFDGARFVKVRRSGVDKGTALCRLAADRGLPVEATVAVGDWYNDVPMLEKAGASFAMGHASPDARQAAHEVLTSTRHTGGAVAEVARKVWGVEP